MADVQIEYGNVGKAAIVQAIGCVSSCHNEIDRIASGCHHCAAYAKQIMAMAHDPSDNQIIKDVCDKCPKRKNIVSPVEQKYGAPNPLCKSALCLYLYLAILNNSEYGIIIDVSVSDAAIELDYTSKTMRKALETLSDKDYITYAPGSKKGLYNVQIKRFEEIYQKHGKGYITVTLDFVRKLAETKQINAVRVSLWEYLNIDQNRVDCEKNGTYSCESPKDVTVSMRALKASLPSYMRAGQIFRAIASCNNLYTMDGDGDNIRFTIKPDMYAYDLRTRASNICKKIIVGVFKEIDGCIDRVRRGEFVSIDEFPEGAYLFGKVKFPHKYKHANLATYHAMPNDKDLNDLVQMSLQYTIDDVLAAIRTIWANTNNPFEIGDYASKVRNLIKNALASSAA